MSDNDNTFMYLKYYMVRKKYFFVRGGGAYPIFADICIFNLKSINA